MKHYVFALLGLMAAGPAAAQSSPVDDGRNRRADCTPNQAEVRERMSALLEAENRHDLDAVRKFVWTSQDTLFVAKTATPEEGNWAGFWGTDVVMQHFHDLYQGTFHMEPDDSRERTAALSCNVVEVYLPVTISVAYGGQNPSPKPFILILDWVHEKNEWLMATDVALPIPPAPPSHN